jgi:hypothetical protein
MLRQRGGVIENCHGEMLSSEVGRAEELNNADERREGEWCGPRGW